jgi:hypothetical protein
MDEFAAPPHAAPLPDALAVALLEHDAVPLDGVERLLRSALRDAVESGRLVVASEFERQRFLDVDLHVLAVSRRGLDAVVSLAADFCFALDCRVHHVPRLIATIALYGDSRLTLRCDVPNAHLVRRARADRRAAWCDWSLERDTANRRGVAAPVLAAFISHVVAPGTTIRRADAA